MSQKKFSMRIVLVVLIIREGPSLVRPLCYRTVRGPLVKTELLGPSCTDFGSLALQINQPMWCRRTATYTPRFFIVNFICSTAKNSERRTARTTGKADW